MTKITRRAAMLARRQGRTAGTWVKTEAARWRDLIVGKRIVAP
ncbi:hypothetical protein O4H66_20955 [Comamonadaceae bacterium G21597-S1]|nr:hypothetical protein [Comamonadaceae bacterium G21597-S1]